ncbi:DUF2529 family protein [Sporosarcina sp. CAU 1771]
MLTTQINGLLQRIATNNEESIEETARLLAQATSGEGRVIIAAYQDMDAVVTAAMYGAEVLADVVRYEDGMELSTSDRVWILTRTETDEPALQLARDLDSRFIPFAVAASGKHDTDNELADLSYTYISTGLTRGLLPGDDEERIVQPHALVALFIYEAVKRSYDEMLSED